MDTGSHTEVEIDLLRRDGSTVAVLVSATVTLDAEGRVVGTRSALVDYSRLRQEQDTLRRVLAASPMAVRVARLNDNQVIFLNRAFCELVRRPEDEARGMDVSANYVDPAVFDDIRERLRHGETVLNRLVELQRPERPELPSVWALASYMQIDYDGTPAALAWLFDVTALRQARSTAEAASRAKSVFLANDEPRDPHADERGHRHDATCCCATPLDARAARLRRPRSDEPRRRTCCTIINDILDFSKIEAGQAWTLEAEPLRPATTCVERRCDLVAAAAAAQAPGAASSTPARCRPAGRRPRRAWRQVAAQPARQRRQVHRHRLRSGCAAQRGRARTATGCCCASRSRDTGIGIAPEQLGAAVPRPSSRPTARPPAQHGGTGLGPGASTRHLARADGRRRRRRQRAGARQPLLVHRALRPRRRRRGRRSSARADAARPARAGRRRPGRIARTRWSRSCGPGLQASRCRRRRRRRRAGASALAASGRGFDLLIVDRDMPGAGRHRDAAPRRTLLGAAHAADGAGHRPATDAETARRRPRGRLRRACCASRSRRSALHDVAGVELLRAGDAAARRRPCRRRGSRRGCAERRRAASILLAEDNPVNQEVALALLRRARAAPSTWRPTARRRSSWRSSAARTTWC
ncbi:MAG: PAS domain-containing protein [Comamonadaceae bacterium]|nr:PAS domain-containing protein [Comamonadaceae bacterium]